MSFNTFMYFEGDYERVGAFVSVIVYISDLYLDNQEQASSPLNRGFRLTSPKIVCN